MIDWDVLPDALSAVGCGERRRNWYLATAEVSEGEVTAVRLTRWAGGPTSPVIIAGEASRNVITFPMGRGPGRPAGGPEVIALMTMARDYAERFDAGGDLEGYPHWRRERSAAKFMATGDANDCPSC